MISFEDKELSNVTGGPSITFSHPNDSPSHWSTQPRSGPRENARGVYLKPTFIFCAAFLHLRLALWREELSKVSYKKKRDSKIFFLNQFPWKFVNLLFSIRISWHIGELTSETELWNTCSEVRSRELLRLPTRGYLCIQNKIWLYCLAWMVVTCQHAKRVDTHSVYLFFLSDQTHWKILHDFNTGFEIEQWDSLVWAWQSYVKTVLV